MRTLTAVLILCIAASFAWATPAKDLRPQLLVQARAANALGQVLTRAADQADAQLQRAAKNAGPTPSNPASPGPNPATAAAPMKAPTTAPAPQTYRALFNRAVLQIVQAGPNVTDPTVDNLTDTQLFYEMASLQLYNQRQFLRLQSLQRQLGIDDDHLDAALQARIEHPQPDPQWDQARYKIHLAVTARLNAAAQQQQAIAPESAIAPAPAASAGPAAGDDPRFQPYYYGPQDALTGWSDIFADPFAFSGGGGLYRRYDTRVNRFNDVRTNTTPDRRVNIDTDRRLNVHSDPRDNF